MLEIRATGIKDWFQYRCDRKFIYGALPQSERLAIPIQERHSGGALAEEGEAFELNVVRALGETIGEERLLQPPRNKGFAVLSEAVVTRFLREAPVGSYAHQAGLGECQTLRADLALPPDVIIGNGRPDLLAIVAEQGKRHVQIIDIKHTNRPTVYHRAQVAMYALMLRALLVQIGDIARVHPTASIWHRPTHAARSGEKWTRADFDVRPYMEMVEDFLRRDVARMSRTAVRRGRDESFFHLYFKCEQCEWRSRCEEFIADTRPVGTWDISVVPGMSHESKRVLNEGGIQTVSDLASNEVLQGTWALRTRGALLRSRAQALLERRWWRLPDHHTWLMPPRIDVRIFLVADWDPVEDRLIALGCLVQGTIARPPRVATIRTPEEELSALKDILGTVLQVLGEVDSHNRELEGRDDAALRAHIFVYEPSEANDLRAAMARHLEDQEIRGSLLNLVRLFPPEEIRAPEPEYRGSHHLPASALRSVMEQLYLLPAKVSYDLARVSVALKDADPPLREPYQPLPAFQRPFSSRLSMEIARPFVRTGSRQAEILQDVTARLRATASLCDWILADNESAEQTFLRLKKPPFRFQELFHPLDAIDLDVLLSQELLQSRADRLAALVELARPAPERRERLRCFANMTLRSDTKNGSRTFLTFDVPPESRDTEIAPGTFGLILTDDDPDVRLDPTQWPACEVSLERTWSSGLVVSIYKKVADGPLMRRMLAKTGERGWFLELAHKDINTERIANFLRFLAGDDR
ncbi:PD-(D/E)XK nuclease family protein [Nannocystis pusilla]|uniref:PD-(D/E)XK nuclease family protein n=1 Tax=Nannocystis pusilla TaxID=889268 RepID=UPI003BEF9735